MNDRKQPHDPGARDRGSAHARGPGTPAPAGAGPADTVHEPPAASRWEDEGGSATEPSPGKPPAAEAPDPVPATAAVAESEFKDRWLRAEAELQNSRRRAAREWEEGRRNAEESVMLEMVAALDDLERALAAARAAGAEQDWTEGVALVAQRMREYLGRQGVTPIDPLGQPFDPQFHEALLEIEAPAGTPDGSVVRVVQKGYRRGDRALRAARVAVGRPPAGSAG